MSMLKRATNPSKQAMVGLDVGGGDTMCPLGVRPPLLRISRETWWTRLLLFTAKSSDYVGVTTMKPIELAIWMRQPSTWTCMHARG